MSPQEYADLERAAGAAGQSVTSYVADAALAAARGTMPPGTWVAAYREVNQARRIAANIGGSLNKTVSRALVGEATKAEVEAAYRAARRAVDRLNEAADVLLATKRGERR